VLCVLVAIEQQVEGGEAKSVGLGEGPSAHGRGSGAIYVNEVNTIPGFTAISMYPQMWEASGVPGGASRQP
jgi:hypothetical protein